MTERRGLSDMLGVRREKDESQASRTEGRAIYMSSSPNEPSSTFCPGSNAGRPVAGEERGEGGRSASATRADGIARIEAGLTLVRASTTPEGVTEVAVPARRGRLGGCSGGSLETGSLVGTGCGQNTTAERGMSDEIDEPDRDETPARAQIRTGESCLLRRRPWRAAHPARRRSGQTRGRQVPRPPPARAREDHTCSPCMRAVAPARENVPGQYTHRQNGVAGGEACEACERKGTQTDLPLDTLVPSRQHTHWRGLVFLRQQALGSHESGCVSVRWAERPKSRLLLGALALEQTGASVGCRCGRRGEEKGGLGGVVGGELEVGGRECGDERGRER